jgi:hypothetical protein
MDKILGSCAGRSKVYRRAVLLPLPEYHANGGHSVSADCQIGEEGEAGSSCGV